MGTLERLALAAVRVHSRSMGTTTADFRHTPLHYPMADLVTGLMLLAEREGVVFERMLKDAREGYADEKKRASKLKKG